MTRAIFLLVLAGFPLGWRSGAYAQTAQPGVLNGVTVWLGPMGTTAVAATRFLSATDVLACETAIPLIERYDPFAPLGSAPSATAAPELLIDCEDPVSFQVLIWIPQFGERWHAVPTYVNVGGFDNCACSTACPGALLLYNGLTGSPADTVAARDFVIDPGAYAGWRFSFSGDPADSLRAFGCGTVGLAPVTIHGLPPSGPATVAETYFARPGSADCTPTALRSPRVIHGLAAAVTVDRSYTVRARDFVPPALRDEAATYTFSPAPADSLLRLDCGAVDTLTGVTLYETRAGEPSTPVRSYLFLTDLIGYCATAPPAPPNDSVENAFLLNPYLDCPDPLLGTTAGATIASNEDFPQSPGQGWNWGPAEGTVWYRFTNNQPLSFTGRYAVTIIPQDSLQVAIYSAQTLDQLPPASDYAAIFETVTDTVRFVLECAFDFGYGYYLQLDGVGGRPARFQLRLTTLDICSPVAEAPPPPRPRFYPNPATDRLWVAPPPGVGIESAQWFDSRGRVLATETPGTTEEYSFRLGPWPSGVYFLRLRLTDGRRITERILKR